MRGVVVLLSILASLPVAAQLAPTIRFTPAAPAPTDVTYVQVTIVNDCALDGPTTVSGKTIESRLTLTACATASANPRTYSTTLGSLTPGTYAYNLYVDNALIATRKVVVDDRPRMPALAPFTLAALAVVVIGFALVRMR